MGCESWGNPTRPGASGRAQDLGPLSCNIGVAACALFALMFFAQSRSSAVKPRRRYIAHRVSHLKEEQRKPQPAAPGPELRAGDMTSQQVAAQHTTPTTKGRAGHAGREGVRTMQSIVHPASRSLIIPIHMTGMGSRRQVSIVGCLHRICLTVRTHRRQSAVTLAL